MAGLLIECVAANENVTGAMIPEEFGIFWDGLKQKEDNQHRLVYINGLQLCQTAL